MGIKQDIKPIETIYNGHRFRSRLEARWAVFFETLGIKYEYEPEGFDLGNGQWYLPDFRVKCYGYRGAVDKKPTDLYIEVKGKMSKEDAKKIRRFSETYPVLVLNGIPPFGSASGWPTFGQDWPMDETDIYPYNYETIDGDYFGAYPACDKYGHFYLWGDDSSYIRTEDIARVEKAYMKARMERFGK